jgi:hypothetical protein
MTVDDLFTLALTLSRREFEARFPYPLLLAANELVLYGEGEGDHTTTSFKGEAAPETRAVTGRPAIYEVKKVHPVIPQGIVVGRLASCDIVIGDRNVSKAHALIQAIEGSWRVSDMGSRNGTHVNSIRLEPKGAAVSIKFGDIVNFAYRTFHFLESGEVWERLR